VRDIEKGLTVATSVERTNAEKRLEFAALPAAISIGCCSDKIKISIIRRRPHLENSKYDSFDVTLVVANVHTKGIPLNPTPARRSAVAARTLSKSIYGTTLVASSFGVLVTGLLLGK